jgi:hypothetical protein
MRVLECFAGVGGNALAMQALGFKTVAYCEINPFSVKVLEDNMKARRLHTAPIFPDITRLQKQDLPAGRIDIIAGGFPCKGLSSVGVRKGLYGDHRSALVKHMYRLISTLKPKFAFLENTPLLRNDPDFPTMIRTLNKLGYGRVAFITMSASQVGARQARKRIFILAVRNGLNLNHTTIKHNISSLKRNFNQNVPQKLLPRTNLNKHWPAKICFAFGNCVVPAQAAQAFIDLRRALMNMPKGVAKDGDGLPLRQLKSVNPMLPCVCHNQQLFPDVSYAPRDVKCAGKGFTVYPPMLSTKQKHKAQLPLLKKPFFSQCFPTFRTHSSCATTGSTMTSRTQQDSGNFLMSAFRGRSDPPQTRMLSDLYASSLSGFPAHWLRKTLLANSKV